MILKLKRTPGIYLAGFMGSGKTTIGQLLAERLGWRFVDLDEEIVAQEGASISSIFETRGEPEFRKIEKEAMRARVREIESGRPTVVALGGGTFAETGNFELIENNGVTIWLDCAFETAARRVTQTGHRPLASDSKRFEALYHTRLAAYRRADFRVESEGDDPDAAVRAILQLLQLS
jgi:shikimate kinase